MTEESSISWFHGTLSREDAESLIRDLNQDGGFLVRESAASPGDFVITLLHNNEVIHYQIIKHGEDALFSIDTEHIFHGLETLIEYYQDDANGLITKLETFCVKDPPPHNTRRHGRTNLLHRATREGNYAIVSGLLQNRNRSIEAKNQEGQTAVHVASKLGKDDILSKLIERGAIVNCRDTAGLTPLHYACQSNLPNTVRLLVQDGQANIQCRNSDTGWVPLHEAAFRGHKSVVNMLLSLNAPAHPRTTAGETPAILAEKSGFHEVAQILQKYKPPEPRMEKLQWYHGTLTRDDALKRLKERGNRDGSYLVRYSNKSGGMLVLDMVHDQQSFHYQIKNEGSSWFIDDGPLFDSLEHVIDYYSTFQDGLRAVLNYPVSPPEPPPVPEKRNEPFQDGLRSMLHHHPLPSPVPNWHSETSGYISFARLTLGNVLGQGEFGSVYKGIYHLEESNAIDVAIKTLRDEHVSDNRTDFLREAKVMMGLDHHCVVKLIGLCKGPPMMMVQELVPLGSMLAYLIEFPDRVNPKYDLKLWASQIACGMKYLEEQRFVHRDLAARNILLASKNQAKISDFGLSRIITDDCYIAKVGGRWPIKWYAPESFLYGTFTHASDVWSYGVTLWEMFSFGKQPYGEMKGSEVIKLVEKGERLEKPTNCPEEVYRVMEQCWNYNARDRPTFARLLEIFSRDPEYINIRELVLGAIIV